MNHQDTRQFEHVPANDAPDIAALPEVGSFYAYGLKVIAHALVGADRETHLLGEIHFTPFNADQFNRLSASIAGIEGLRRYFEYLEQEEAQGNHVTPECLVGVTNYYMAQATEKLGFTVQVIDKKESDKQIMDSTERPLDKKYLVTGSIENLRSSYNTLAAKYVDRPNGENRLLRHARRVSPGLWAKFDRKGMLNVELADSAVERLVRFRAQPYPPKIDQFYNMANLAVTTLIRTIWGIEIVIYAFDTSQDFLILHNPNAARINAQDLLIWGSMAVGYEVYQSIMRNRRRLKREERIELLHDLDINTNRINQLAAAENRQLDNRE